MKPDIWPDTKMYSHVFTAPLPKESSEVLHRLVNHLLELHRLGPEPAGAVQRRLEPGMYKVPHSLILKGLSSLLGKNNKLLTGEGNIKAVGAEFNVEKRKGEAISSSLHMILRLLGRI